MQSTFNAGDNLGCLDGGSITAKVDRILIQIGMMAHQGMLIVDCNAATAYKCFRNFISGIDSRIRRTIACIRSHRGCGGPNKSSIWCEVPHHSEKAGKSFLVLFFTVAPAVHPIIEVHNSEPDRLHGVKLPN